VGLYALKSLLTTEKTKGIRIYLYPKDIMTPRDILQEIASSINRLNGMVSTFACHAASTCLPLSSDRLAPL